MTELQFEPQSHHCPSKYCNHSATRVDGAGPPADAVWPRTTTSIANMITVSEINDDICRKTQKWLLNFGCLNTQNTPQIWPCFSVSCHVLFGLSLLFVSWKSKLTTLGGSRCKICAITLLCLLSRVSCKMSITTLCSSSSFMIWSLQDTLQMLFTECINTLHLF